MFSTIINLFNNLIIFIIFIFSIVQLFIIWVYNFLKSTKLPGGSNSSDNNITINRVWTSNSGGSKKIEVTDNTVNVSFCDQRTDYKDVFFTAEIIEKNDSRIYLKINNITDPNSKSSWNINQYTVIEYSSLTKDSVIMKLAIGSYANIETIKNTNPLYWSTATYTKK